MRAHERLARPLGAARRAHDADPRSRLDRARGHRVVDLHDGHAHDLPRDVDRGRGRGAGEDDQPGAGIRRLGREGDDAPHDRRRLALAHQVAQQALVEHVDDVDGGGYRAGQQALEALDQHPDGVEDGEAAHHSQPSAGATGRCLPPL
jgi:hypothetical protein